VDPAKPTLLQALKRQAHGRDPAARVRVRIAAQPDALDAAGLACARRVDIKTIGVFGWSACPTYSSCCGRRCSTAICRRCSGGAAAGSCCTRSRWRSRSRIMSWSSPENDADSARRDRAHCRVPVGVPGHRHRRLPRRRDSAAGAGLASAVTGFGYRSAAMFAGTVVILIASWAGTSPTAWSRC
jgi:hypothetical protein